MAVYNPEKARMMAAAPTPAAPATPAVPAAPVADINDVGFNIAAANNPVATPYTPPKTPVDTKPKVPTTGSTTTSTTDINPDQNALQQAVAFYTGIGLGGDIATAITKLYQEGYVQDTINAIMQDPSAVNSSDPAVKAVASAYSTRFGANATRIKNGLTPLSPSAYIKNENDIRVMMQAAGLPEGYYNNNAVLSDYIAKGTPISDVQAKVSAAADILNNADQAIKDQAKYLYGLDDSHLLAHILDPNAALPLIQKQVNMINLGAAASRQGLTQSAGTLEAMNAAGVSQAAAQSGFAKEATVLPTQQALAAMAGQNAGNVGADITAATFNLAGAGQANVNINAAQQAEINRFSGSSGVGKGSLLQDMAGQQ
jgi:hypothetical protein